MLNFEPTELDLMMYENEMHGYPPVGPLTKAQQEEIDAELAFIEKMEKQCGCSISTGGFDPYGTACDLDKGHDGPHEGPDFFVEGARISWSGGGYCAGDPLPVRNLKRVA